MYVAWSLNPLRWRFGRHQTYTIHPTTGRDIVQNNWICFGPICVSFDDNDPFEP